MIGEPSISVHVDATIGTFRHTYALRTHARTLGLTGPSGTGKSVLLSILAGVETRILGTIAVRGAVWYSSTAGIHVPPWKRRTGWAPQDALLFPHRSVRDNLVVAVGADRVEADIVARALEISHLLDRAPRHLSGGERQRVALGRALVARPELLLLDEPFAALDAALRNRVREFLRQWLSTRDVTTVIVSHDADDLVHLCEEIITLDSWRAE